MKHQTHSSERFYRSLSALLILLAFYSAAMPTGFFVNAAPVIKSGGDNNQDDFDKKFREARDLIDREEWARAAEKFGAAIEKYPDAKSADAALYWLAFCYKKQNQFEKADGALDRLLEKFPASSWAADARVMKMEIAASRGDFKKPAAAIFPANATKGTATTAPCPYESLIASGNCANAARATPLDREDEIKIAAFRSLLVADPPRAIEALGGILKTDSKASEILKLEMLRASRSPRLQKTGSMMFDAVGAVAKEFAPLLRETLVKSFENETNVKIRREIIYALASQMDDESTGYLKKLYAGTDDRELKRAVVNSFTPPTSSFYAFETTTAAKRKTESDFLWEIVRAEKDSELRRQALANLQRFPKWADEQTIELLSRLYDAETDEPFKISIIRAIAAANRTGTGRKLLDIARHDRSDKLRLEAIFFLRGSKNPEAIKFLEDLIK